MYFRFFYITLCFYLLFLPSFPKPIINWYKHDLPPFYISSGTYENRGSVDSAIKIIQKNMDDFEHYSTSVALRRISELAKSDNFFATYTLFKTVERENFLVYSNPYGIRFLTHLVILKENMPKFKKYIDSDGKVDFEKVVQDSSITISLSSNRFYSNAVNSVLISYANQKNIDFVYSQNATLINISKLELGRVDCIVEYPSTVIYEFDLNKINKECIYIPIKGVPDFEYVYIAFPKTDYGAAMVKRINIELSKVRMNENYIDELSKWNNDKELYKKVYKKAISDYFYKK